MNGLRKGGKRSFRKMLNSTNEKGRGGAIKNIGFYSGIIETVGYDPQCAILEIRLAEDGKVRRYGDVPEDAWYRLRESYHPDTYYRRYICGHYKEYVVPESHT